MDDLEYINILKRKIKTRRTKDEDNGVLIDPNYFDTLLDKIKSDVLIIIKASDLNEISDDRLKSLYNLARMEHESVFPLEMNPCGVLGSDKGNTWLDESRMNEIKWNYSNRYFDMYRNKVDSDIVNENLKKSAFTVLKRLGDPKSNTPFYVKGLVVGSVQSGKTANFNAVINASIDSGYRLVIVLAGLMEDLRVQTQDRIDNDVRGEGVVDTNTNRRGLKGVGLVKRFGNFGDSTVEQVITITSHEQDFKKTLKEADFALDHINILVCKKNVSVLKNLIIWLHEHLGKQNNQLDVPLLIIDDEADNASLNNLGKKGRNYASRTNGHIRALLGLFQRKSYLGYTATPFANVLQDQNEAPENDWAVSYKVKSQPKEIQLTQVDNIFPDNFIVLLKPPSNYVGAKQLFTSHNDLDSEETQEKLPLLEIVRDELPFYPSRLDIATALPVPLYRNKDEFEDDSGWLRFGNFQSYRESTRASKPSDNYPEELPRSLKESILCFILSICVRDIRSKEFKGGLITSPHHTMLVHISRFKEWQNKTEKLIKEYMSVIRDDLFNDSLDSSDSIYNLFRTIWDKYYSEIVGRIDTYLPDNYVDKYMTEISYEKIQELLPSVINEIQVLALNSSKESRHNKLVYSDDSPIKAIVVGGNRLSRGFTLEGLVINYFIRTTNYSDTLLQMGRWFGYRPGYLDCCKIFTKDDIVQSFDRTTLTISELESEFTKMELKGKTPKDFILRVRKHPGVLKITRDSIMKDVREVNWSYQDKLEQTTTFEITKDKTEKVFKVFKEKIAPSLAGVKEESKFLKYRASIDDIVALLKLDNNFDEETSKTLVKFLGICKDKKKLESWTVGIRCKGRASVIDGKGLLTKEESGLPVDVNMSIRTGPKKSESNKTTRFRDELLYKNLFKASGLSENILTGGLDMAISMTPDRIEECQLEFKDEKIKYFVGQGLTSEAALEKYNKIKNIPERAYRERLPDTEGVLIIYLFDMHYVLLQEKSRKEIDLDFKDFIKRGNIDLNVPLVGYAIGIPPINPDPGGVYVVGDYSIEEDEDDLDDIDIEDMEEV
jgi:hypothetical protein